MSAVETMDAFTSQEFQDIAYAAAERGITPWELLHDAVMADLYR